MDTFYCYWPLQCDSNANPASLSGSDPAKNSYKPKSDILTTHRLSIRQLDVLRFPWDLIGVACKNTIPCFWKDIVRDTNIVELIHQRNYLPWWYLLWAKQQTYCPASRLHFPVYPANIGWFNSSCGCLMEKRWTHIGYRFRYYQVNISHTIIELICLLLSF